MADDEVQAVVEDVVTVGRPVALRVKALLADRDAMLSTELAAGIFVSVVEDGKLYQRDPTNTAWIDYGASVLPTVLSDYIALVQKAAADGVASLGPGGKVPSTQIDSTVWEALNHKGQANGYAALDADSKVPLAQLPVTVAGIGNPTLRPRLIAYDSLVTLFCSPIGDDVTGDGTFGAPFRQAQRCLDEIPDHVSGTVQVVALAGNYDAWTLRPLYSPLGLVVVVNGDTTAADAVVTFPAGAHPKLVTAPSKDNPAVFENDAGVPLGITFSPGSHWADGPYDYGAGPIASALGTIDGAHSSGSKVRLVRDFDFLNLVSEPVSIRPIVATVDLSGTFYPIAIVNQNAGRGGLGSGSGVNMVVQGFKFAADNFIQVVGCSVLGCAFAGPDAGVEFSRNDHSTINSYFSCSSVSVVDGNVLTISGIMDCTLNILGPCTETFLQGVQRGRDGDGVAGYFGGPTGGRIGDAGTAVEVEFWINESSGGFDQVAAGSRWGNHGPAAFDGSSSWINARNGGKVLAQTVYGTTTNIPVILETGVLGLRGFAALSGQLSNTGAPGTEWKTRADGLDAGTTGAFSALPHTDAANFILLR